jgi:hypothetical protein
MRQKRYAVALSFLLLVVPVVLAQMAPSISLSITPNPKKMPGKLLGEGTWDLAGQGTLVSITFETELKGTGQVISKPATINGKLWEATLTVAPGTYNPSRAIMRYVDAAKKSQSMTVPNNNDQIVK